VCGFILRCVYYEYSNFNVIFSSFVVGFRLYCTLLDAVTMQGISKMLRQISRVSSSHQNKEKSCMNVCLEMNGF
jgi:hypothetical protein